MMTSDWKKYLPKPLRERVEQSAILQRIIHNTGWLFIDKALRMGVGFFVAVWVTRYLGPEKYGVMSYAAAFVGLFTAIANLGLYGIVIRNIVRAPEATDEILGTAFALKIAGGITSLLLAVCINCLMRPQDTFLHYAVAVTALGLVFQSFDVFDFWFQSQLLSKRTVFANVPGFILITIAKIILVIAKAPLVAFIWAGAVEILLGSIGLLVAYQMITKQAGRLKFSRHWAKSLLKDCWPLIFGGLMLMIYNRIDQVMIGQMLGTRSVGLYSVAVKLAEFWYVFPTLILNSVLPSLVEAKKSSEEFYYRRLQKVFDIMAVISFAFVLPLFFFSNPIISGLYGSQYAEAGGILAIYVLSGIFVFIGHVREYWVTVDNVTRFSLYSTTLGAIVNILLNFLLIPRFGGIGAAYATLVSLCVATYLVNLFHHRTRKIFLMQTKAILLVSMFLRVKGVAATSEARS
jgi:polysaccharide transporter, PST family